MNVRTVLDEIERVAGGMVNLPLCEQSERVRDYVTIRVLIQELEEWDTKGKDGRQANERLQQLKSCCRSLAGLGEENAPPDKETYSQAREALRALRTLLGNS